MPGFALATCFVSVSGRRLKFQMVPEIFKSSRCVSIVTRILADTLLNLNFPSDAISCLLLLSSVPHPVILDQAA